MGSDRKNEIMSTSSNIEIDSDASWKLPIVGDVFWACATTVGEGPRADCRHVAQIKSLGWLGNAQVLGLSV